MSEKIEGYFDSTAELFKSYRQKMKGRNDPSFSNRLAQEVRKRIDQLSFICQQVKELEIAVMQRLIPQMPPFDPRCPPSDWKNIASTHPWNKKLFEEYKSTLFEMEFFVEAFYFFADRIRSILRHKRRYTLPGLHNFDSKGVREVRNHLLQHPEKYSKITSQSFGIGDDVGPRLKIAYSEGDDPVIVDKGFWVNAKEFKVNLESVLSKVLANKD